MDTINEQLLFKVKADVDQALKAFQNLDTVLANVQKQAAGLQKSLGKKLNAPSVSGGASSFVKDEKNKQKAINDTTKTQIAAFTKIKNAILPGLGAGIGMAMANLGIQAGQMFIQAVGRGIEFNAMKEVSMSMFKVMLKDGPAAVKLMDDLQDKALKSSMNLREAVSSSKQLVAYGFGTKELVSTMSTLNDVTSATGTRLDDLAYVYGTLRTQGRAYTRDIMQFAMRGIPIYEELAKVLGVNVSQIKAMTEAGKVGFTEVEKAFQNMTGAGGVFFKAGEARLETLTGKQEQLEKKIDIMLGKMAEAFTPLIKESLGALDYIVESYINAFDILSNLGGGKERKDALKLLGSTDTRSQEKGLSDYINNAGLSKEFSGSNPDFYFKSIFRNIAGGMDMVAKVSKETGQDQLKVAEMLYNKGYIIADVWAKVADEAESAAKLARMGAASTAGALGKLLTNLGIGIEGYASQQGGKGATAELLRGQAGVTAFTSNTAVKTYENLNKAALQSAEDLAKKLQAPDLADDAIDAYVKGLNSAIDSTMDTLINGNLPGTVTVEVEKYLKWLYGELKKYEEKKGRSKKAKEAKDDPFLYEQMKVATTMTELDDVLEDHRKQVESIKKAYEGTVGLTGKMNAAITLAEESFNNVTRATKKFEQTSTVGAQIGVAQSKLYELGGNSAAGAFAREEQFRLDAAKRVYDFEIANKDKVRNKEFDDAKKLFDLQEEYLKKSFDREENMRRADESLTGNPEFWNNIKAGVGEALKNGDTLAAAGGTAAGAFQGTDIGSLAAKSDPIMMLVKGFMDAAMKVESFGKVVNFVSTLFDAAFAEMGDTFQLLFEPLQFLLEAVGELAGEVLKPFVTLGVIVMDIIYGALVPLMLILELVGGVFEWLNDNVIVPIGNAFIDAINGVITALNTALGFLGVDIKLLSRLQTSLEQAEKEKKLALATDVLAAALDYLKNKLKDEVDATVKSLQDLYEVGAISATEYEARSTEAMDLLNSYTDDQYQLIKQYLPNLLELDGIPSITQAIDLVKKEISEMDKNPNYVPNFDSLNTAIGNIVTTLQGGIAITNWPTMGATASQVDSAWVGSGQTGTWSYNGQQVNVPNYTNANYTSGAQALKGFAVGTTNVPSDMTANIHKGEAIVPETFADGIRKGDMALTSTSGMGANQGGNVYVTVQVAGSVQAENDLANSIARAINKNRRTGVLTT